MKLVISKSKNSESYYIAQSYKNSDGKSTSKTIRKLGTLKDLKEKLNTDRDGVFTWAKEQVRLETEAYRKDGETHSVLVPFPAAREIDYNKQRFYIGGYLVPQSIYYGLRLDHTMKTIKKRHSY